VSSRARQQSNGFLTTRNAWIEGRTPRPSGLLSVYEGYINILLGLFLGGDISSLLCPERDAIQPVTIINKLSGKALEAENASINQCARIHQVTRSGEPNQQWLIKPAKLTKHHVIPAKIYREVHRGWPSFLRFAIPSYLVIAVHSGLCLDILNGSMENGGALMQSPITGQSTHLWAFARDQQGYNFIVNLDSGKVLDVVDNSLNNFATVKPFQFNGTDSQRWQVLV
jgi:Ricin-type beta-trefoil lectin domain-like